MRKLLLASVAGLGVWGAASSDAGAQTVTTNVGGTYTVGPMSGAALPAMSTPTPGSVIVRLNGRVRFYAFGVWDRDVDNNAAGTATGTFGANGVGTATGGYKQSNYGFAEYGRLYPGFDGVAANGLKYGAAMEIRQDASSGAGGGVYGSVSGASRSRAELYFRRVYGYLGTNEFGTIRVGAVDQPTSYYLTGNYENFNDGAWNGDAPSFISAPARVAWPFEDTGNLYTTNKIVYLSPSIVGFDGGVSFEPSTANLNGADTNCGSGNPFGTNFVNAAGTFTAASGASSSGASSAGCDRLSSSPNNSESGRRRNTWDMVLRYRGSFGPVGIAATAGYITSSHVLDNQTGVPFNNNPTTGTIRRNYEGLNVGDFGLAVTAGGLSVGGHYMRGRVNGGWTLVPSGFADTDAGVIGASYTLGPVIVGASWLWYTSAGDLGNAYFGRIRREAGLAYGGTYSIAPGVSLFLSGLWGERKQNGYNFVTGQGVSSTAPAGNPFNNKVTSNLIAVGTAFSW